MRVQVPLPAPPVLPGVPTGATASFSGPLALPSLGTTTLQIATTATAAVGDASLVVAGDGGSRTASAHLYVNAPPVVSTGGPYTVAEGSTVTLAGSATDADHDALAAAWDLNGDGTFETAGLTPAFVGLDGPASIPVRLRVCDDHGACAAATATVTVTNVAPTVRISAPADGTIVPVGTPVGFAGSFTDPAAYVGTTPRGFTAIETPLGNFSSTSYRYLVVSGSTFELDGLGTFHGVHNVPFHLGGVNGRPDRLRVRIGTTYDSGGPVALAGGSILIRP